MALVTLAEAKAQLGIAEDDTSEDDELNLYIAGLSRAIERETGEAPEQRTAIERIDARRVFALNVLPVASLTSIVSVTDGRTWDVTDFDADGPSGVVIAKSGASGPCGAIRVTYTAGHETVPGNVKLAALIILQHVWETQRGAASGSGGVVGVEEAYDPRMGYAVPRRAAELLGSRMTGFA